MGPLAAFGPEPQPGRPVRTRVSENRGKAPAEIASRGRKPPGVDGRGSVDQVWAVGCDL